MPSSRPLPCAAARRAPSGLECECQSRSRRPADGGCSRRGRSQGVVVLIVCIACIGGSARGRRQWRARERLLEPFQRCGEARLARVGIDPEGRERIRVGAAAAAPERHAPVRQHVEHRRVLGEPQRILERQRDEPGAELDAPRALRDGLEQHQRRGQPTVFGAEVMLGDEAGAEAELQPAGRQRVEHRRILGHPQRRLQRQHDYRAAPARCAACGVPRPK